MSNRRIESLRLIWLEAFLWAHYTDSISEAARALGCNQSNVSRYVAQLEDWLRKRLFSSYMPVTLTDEGKEFASTAIEVVESMYRARTVIPGEYNSILDILGELPK